MDVVKILDGGFSTQLAKHVGERIDGDPLWTSRYLSIDPNAIYKTHLDFLRAGSDIIETNTYQASIGDFMKYLKTTEHESRELIKIAIVEAKRAVKTYKSEIGIDDVKKNEPIIVGSIGPYAACLHDCSEYTGASYKNIKSMDPIVEWHKPRLETLIENGIDFFAIETIPCAREAEALVNLLKNYPNVKAWLSFSCKDDGKSIADGSDFKETVLQCLKIGNGQIIAAGVNCLSPKSVSPLLKSIGEKEIGQFLPKVAYPNSGEKYSSETFSWIKDQDFMFYPPAKFVKEWLDIGVRYIGGCCRVDATSIKQIKNEVDNWLNDRCL